MVDVLQPGAKLRFVGTCETCGLRAKCDFDDLEIRMSGFYRLRCPNETGCANLIEMTATSEERRTSKPGAKYVETKEVPFPFACFDCQSELDRQYISCPKCGGERVGKRGEVFGGTGKNYVRVDDAPAEP